MWNFALVSIMVFPATALSHKLYSSRNCLSVKYPSPVSTSRRTRVIGALQTAEQRTARLGGGCAQRTARASLVFGGEGEAVAVALSKYYVYV